MRIGIDGRLSGSRHAGIGRYVENLLTRLPSQAPHISWVFFQSEPGQLSFAEKLANVELVTAPIKHYTIREQWELPAIIDRAKLDLFHVPHFNVPLKIRCPLVITVHDLLWHEFKGAQVTTLPAWWYWPKYLGYRLVSNRAIHKAEAILVPAETVKQTVVRYYPETESKIVVTKEGTTKSFVVERAASSPQKKLVYLGSLYPHKNIEVVLQALTELPEYELLIIGSRNIFQEKVAQRVSELGITNQVRFLGYLSDAEVATILSTATALVQPSLSEGFGLTGVEAMAAGVPVIASDIPIFREVYQSAVRFFDPYDPQALCRQIQAARDPITRKKLIAAGRTTAEQYSWESMVEETIAVYHRVLANHSRHV